MRAAQERLPPKKRDLPPAEAAASSETSSGQGSRPSQAAPCYEEGPEAVPGLPLDQYGLLYKVASFSPVVNVGPLSQAYSQLLPPQPSAYSPLHYTQLPPALLQLVGSHYSVPYTMAPAFLPSPLLHTSTTHIPHLVPYAPLLTDDATPQDAHGFGKSTASSPLQQPLQHLDGPQGRIPVYYQATHLPGGYSPFEAPVAAPSTEQPLRDGQTHPKIVTANGVLRPPVGAKDDVGEGRWTSGTDAPFVAGTEASAPSQRSTPEMDLEVQRVVGVLASPDCGVGSVLQKDGLSPLNLSHREQKGESERNPPQCAEKSYSQRLSAKSPEEQLCHLQLLKGMMMVNGEQASGSLQRAVLDGPGRTSPGGPLDADSGPSQVQLPSHFMKGAIIQLATGELKRVEDLQTQDFVRSAEVSGGLKIDSSTVVDVQESPWQGFVTLHFVVGEQQSKVSIDVPPEHPFFVYGQGWSSCSPERTARLFSLSCHRLQVGDVCISISLQSLNGRLAPQASPQEAIQERLGRGSQGLREPQLRAREKNLVEKGGAGLGSSQEPPHLEPLALHGWAGPSYQRFGEESWPPLLRPSFIPQEVKLSIEGRSNAGK